jgi:hypothetical protein
VRAGQTDLDTSAAGEVSKEAIITIKLTGTKAAIQADWATIAGTSLTASSAIMSHGGEGS